MAYATRRSVVAPRRVDVSRRRSVLNVGNDAVVNLGNVLVPAGADRRHLEDGSVLADVVRDLVQELRQLVDRQHRTIGTGLPREFRPLIAREKLQVYGRRIAIVLVEVVGLRQPLSDFLYDIARLPFRSILVRELRRVFVVAGALAMRFHRGRTVSVYQRRSPPERDCGCSRCRTRS